MTKNPEAVPANQGQDKKDLSKAEQMNLLIKDLNDPAKQSDKDDIVSKMLSLILGDKKNELGGVDAEGNPLKRKEVGDKGIDNDDKMMMMALALIFGAMAIAVTGGVAGAAIIGAAPAIGVVPDLMQMGKDFLGKSENILDEEQSKSLGKSLLAFLLADKVKDNIMNFGDRLLSDDNNFVKSIGKYIDSLRGMDEKDKTREIDSLKTMVRGNVSLLEGKGADKSDAKTGSNPSEADQKFNAIFAQFEAMISNPKEEELKKDLISSLREIRVGDAIVRIEATTAKGGGKSGNDPVAGEGGVPSTASSARNGDVTTRAQSLSDGRSATAPAPAAPRGR